MSYLGIQREYSTGKALWMLAVSATLTIGLSLDAHADSWGSFGGSHGSNGGSSGGSFGSSGGFSNGGSSGGGSGGLFGGRRPVRNLLGRISERFHGGRNNGSSGGSTGFSYASGGSHGSHGSHGSYGSISHGSSGGGYSSLGSVGVSYGSSGSSFGSSGGGYSPVTVGYPPVMSDFGGMNGGQIIYDSGYVPGSVMAPGTMMPGTMMPGTVMPGTMTSPGTNDFRPVDGINFEGGSGQSINPSTTPGGSGNGVPRPAINPGQDGSTGLMSTPSATVLNLKLPADAVVYINNKLTRTPGEVRRYVARNLQPGNDYEYDVKAVVVRDGVERVRSQVVSIAGGSSKMVELDFDTAITSVAVNVPANAKITLCGTSTSAAGNSRIFSTTNLNEGESWNDYTIEVTMERNGKTIRQEKRLNIVGGETYQVSFEFDAATEMLAVN